MSLRLAARRFSTSAVKLFEKEKEVKAQAVDALSSPSGQFQSFAQYRLKIVQKDPLSLQTRRTFVQGNPAAVETNEVDEKFRRLAKKISLYSPHTFLNSRELAVSGHEPELVSAHPERLDNLFAGAAFHAPVADLVHSGEVGQRGQLDLGLDTHFLGQGRVSGYELESLCGDLVLGGHLALEVVSEDSGVEEPGRDAHRLREPFHRLARLDYLQHLGHAGYAG
ncbi:hypothetical protein OGAPHI_002160 [Ogataea philodendri]|uniref:Uncharacterized protein n=1 Tax=Ogataea philodendri TaxID=1378263 RepID=A0A9P8T7X1_9ASCO|nr:uncharacterized protein OGAPHI_002160 [Ogataea philodendri]KAH3668406.1 hypothetical protein OGAPHI_002160 [Ogataea philodendri]